ncbi:MAG: hypothetical protein IT364_14710 [Candidatus Hydrogenedentes bacterium]|nr:hypothetical protein [Candidatus Hydrogenedentota bacterium]
MTACATAQNDLSLVTPTVEYLNELSNTSAPGGNLSNTISTTAVFFGGTVGPYAIPNSGDTPAVPAAGGILIAESSFGQAFSRTIPFANFDSQLIDQARAELFYADAIAQGKDPLITAFRFINLLYADNSGTDDPFSILETTVNLGGSNVANVLQGLYNTTIDDTDSIFSEGERSALAERLLREALRFAPTSEDIANSILDIAYARAVANGIIAKEYVVLAAQQNILPAPPTGFVIDNEIQYLETALELTKSATEPYFTLFQDRIGVNTTLVDPVQQDNPPFGYYIFQKLVPRRPLFVDGFAPRNPGTTDPNTGEYTPGTPTGGTLLPLVDQNGQPISLVLQGYKDWAFLWDNLRDQMQITKDLGRLYGLRGGIDDEGKLDRDKALELIDEAQQQGLLRANVLLGVFPDFEPQPGDVSGIAESISGAYTSISELDSVRDFLTGSNNLLGYSPDFLMLVQNFVGLVATEQVFDSFDAFIAWLTQDNSPLLTALNDYEQAVDSYDEYRGTIDELATQMRDSTLGYRDRLTQITGIDPGPDPRNPLDPRYLNPEDNAGSEIFQQLISIEKARLQIRRNAQEITNNQEQISIEVARRAEEEQINADLQDLIIDYGDQQADLTEEIGAINAAQAFANEMAAAADAFGSQPDMNIAGGVVHTINAVAQAAFEVGKAFLEGDKEQLAAQEEADIVAKQDLLLDNNSQALIKNLMLEQSILAIDSLEAALLLAQEISILDGLMIEKQLNETRLLESGQNLVNRFFADPVHRLRVQRDMLYAQQSYEVAQNWIFFVLRAFEYKWNVPFIYSDPTGAWSIQSIFRARNALELNRLKNALTAFDGLLQGTSRTDDRFDWFSFTEDFLGYKQLAEDGVTELTYLDPNVGDVVTAKEIFRRHLKANLNEDGVIHLVFNTVKDKGTFFRGPRYTSSGTVLSPGQYLDKIIWMKINVPGSHAARNRTVTARLAYGGTSYLRTPVAGVIDPNQPDRIEDELTAWSSRFFYFDPGKPFANPPVAAGWRFKDAQESVVPLNLGETDERPDSVLEIEVFKERSVATTQWEMDIFTEEDGEQVLDIDAMDDIEILFYHTSKDRLR